MRIGLTEVPIPVLPEAVNDTDEVPAPLAVSVPAVSLMLPLLVSEICAPAVMAAPITIDCPAAVSTTLKMPLVVLDPAPPVETPVPSR